MICLQPNLVFWYIIISWSALWKIGVLCTKSVAISVFPDSISWTIQPFVAKVSMVVYYREMECCAEKKLFHFFKVKGTARVHVIKMLLFLL